VSFMKCYWCGAYSDDSMLCDDCLGSMRNRESAFDNYDEGDCAITGDDGDDDYDRG